MIHNHHDYDSDKGHLTEGRVRNGQEVSKTWTGSAGFTLTGNGSLPSFTGAYIMRTKQNKWHN